MTSITKRFLRLVLRNSPNISYTFRLPDSILSTSVQHCKGHLMIEMTMILIDFQDTDQGQSNQNQINGNISEHI